MTTKLPHLMATIPLIVASVVTNTSLANAATIGSSIDFSGYVFGSLTQMDYVDPSMPLLPSPNVDGSFQVFNATGSFKSALTATLSIGTIHDFSQGISPGIIAQAGPVLNGSDNPDFYVPNFLSLTTSNSVNFTFQLETVERTVVFDPNSDPFDPSILSISAILTGTLTDLETNEVQAAIGSFTPDMPPGIKLSQFTPDNFLGPATYNGSLQVVPEPTTNAGLALFGVFCVGYGVKKRKKL